MVYVIKLNIVFHSVDINNFKNIDLVKDIEFLQKEDIPFLPDFIWASPPCTTYSIAAIGYHRDMGKPKTKFAEKTYNLHLNVHGIHEFPENFFS